MTFYLINPNDPYYDLATFPNTSIEDVVEIIKEDDDFKHHPNYIPMTASERKRFISKCESDKSQDYIRVYESMKDSFTYNQFLENAAESKVSYSFWITSAFDTRTTFYAVGADTVGKHDCNLSRIAKSLGEKKFYDFCVGKGKRIKKFSTLIKTLNELGVRDIKITEEDLINAYKEDQHYVFRGSPRY